MTGLVIKKSEALSFFLDIIEHLKSEGAFRLFLQRRREDIGDFGAILICLLSRPKVRARDMGSYSQTSIRPGRR